MYSIEPSNESLTVKDREELIQIGKRITLSLSCNANGDGLPCRTDRFQAIDDMIDYLNIATVINHHRGE